MTEQPTDQQPTSGDNDTERVTVTLIPKARRDLAELVTSTRLTRTDLVNRAVTLYAVLSGHLDAGREVAIHDPANGTTRVLVIA